MNFSERLYAARKAKKMTAEELAKACGISRSYVTLLENGNRPPSVKLLPKIAGALGQKTNVVLNWYLEDVRVRLEKKLEITH